MAAEKELPIVLPAYPAQIDKLANSKCVRLWGLRPSLGFEFMRETRCQNPRRRP